MTPESLVKTVEDFLAGSRGAVVMEDGAVAFDLEQAKYSISGERNKCLLHLWSAERNVLRRVLEAEVRHETLRLAVQRMGQTKPTKVEICRERDRRTPTVKKAARLAYRRVLEHLLQRRFSGFTVGHLSTAMDLEFLRSNLRAWIVAPRTIRIRSHRSERSRDASVDRCHVDLRNSMARRLPAIAGR
jgi:hypothetical protein